MIYYVWNASGNFEKILNGNGIFHKRALGNGIRAPSLFRTLPKQLIGRWLTKFWSTKVTKLLLFFKFTLLHRRLATSDFQNKIGIREMIFVPFWRTEKESLFHIFWSYVFRDVLFLQGFMKRLTKNQIKLESIIFTADLILGPKSDTLFITKQYFYFLVARYYIWSC